jgi:gamma-glutamylaminecyclotransferase
MHRVFVYGTLKRGYPNFDVGMSGTEYVGDYRTVERYPLVISSPWYTPNLLDEPGMGHQIRGELFLATDEAVEFLDHFEMVHLPNGYRREICALEKADESDRVDAWTYFRDRHNLDSVLEELTGHYSLENRYVVPSKRNKA